MATVEPVSLQVSLPQMLDLALGTPEIGAVNFNILHNFLHILLHQSNLQYTKVEYRGADADRIKIAITSHQNGPAVYIQEYNITDSSGNTTQRNINGELTGDIISDDPNTKTTTGLKQTIGKEGMEGQEQKVFFIEPIVNGVTPTALGFKQLQQTVDQLLERFQALEELSSNEEIVQRLKGKIGDPVTDVWQVINITKRLDATEKGIDKLTSMIQDIMKQNPDIELKDQEMSSDIESRLKHLEYSISKIEETMKNIQILANAADEEDVPIPALTASIKESEADVADPSLVLENANKAESADTEDEKHITKRQNAPRVSLNKIQEITSDVTKLKSQVVQLRDDIDNINDQVAKNFAASGDEGTKKSEKLGKRDSQEEGRKFETNQSKHEVQEKTDVLEKTGVQGKAKPQEKTIVSVKSETERQQTADKDTVADKSEKTTKKKGSEEILVETNTNIDKLDVVPYIESVQKVEQMCNEAKQKLTERIEKIEQNVATLFENMQSASAVMENSKGDISDLISKIQGIQDDMGKLNEVANKLISDRENQDIHWNALLEQMELLKTIKADKEDLEDALADKADAQAVNRKVSHEQFDAACEDLTRGLEDAINKLGKQEEIWQQALDEIQKEIEGKVDKIEMTPLRDFVSNRLKMLQEKVKSVAELRQETEAAGTKKLLKDVECISCNKNVVMRTEETAKFQAPAVPGTLSVKPYLTYELDQVRKQQRRLPHAKNMIQFEAAMQEDARRQKSPKLEGTTKTSRDDHLCHRYCGGSHTVMTPQQRVTRTGHYLDQWGPQSVQLTDGMTKGNDGKMYRSRQTPAKFDVCGTICEEKSEEKIRPTEQAARISSTRRKSTEYGQSSAEIRRRSSNRKPSKELPSVPLKEMFDDARIRPLEPEEMTHDVISDKKTSESNESDIDSNSQMEQFTGYQTDELEGLENGA